MNKLHDEVAVHRAFLEQFDAEGGAFRLEALSKEEVPIELIQLESVARTCLSAKAGSVHLRKYLTLRYYT